MRFPLKTEKQGETAIIKMKIEIKNPEVKFEEVPIGSLFACPAYSHSENNIYMATEEYLDRVDNEKVNAVCLCDGALHEFNDNDKVRLLDNAKLVIG